MLEIYGRNGTGSSFNQISIKNCHSCQRFINSDEDDHVFDFIKIRFPTI